MITLKEAATRIMKRFNLPEFDVQRIRNWIKSGTLPGSRILGKYYVNPQDLDDYLTENTKEFK